MPGNKYELTYFTVKGFGNMVRIILEDQGLPYEFHPVTLETWPTIKPKMPLGQVPMLTVNGSVHIGQSHAICRFLGREQGLMGSSNIESAQVDMWVEQSVDLRRKFVQAVYFNWETGVKPFIESIPSELATFEKQLSSGDGKHFLFGKLTLADYMIFDVLHYLKALSDTCLDKTPKVKAFYANFYAREKLHAFLERPDIKEMKYTGTPHL